MVRKKEKLNGLPVDLQLQTAKGGRMSVNRLHLRVEEVRAIEENISLLRRSP